jgi:integrase
MKQRTWKTVAILENCIIKQSEDPDEPFVFQVRSRGSNRKPPHVFYAQSISEAINIAPLKHGLAFSPPSAFDTGERISVFRAFDEAMKNSKRTAKKSIDEWDRATERFLSWIKINYPALRYWDELTRPLFKQYESYLLTSGKVEIRSANTMRLAFQPIGQTSLYMQDNYGTPDYCRKIANSSAKARHTPTINLVDVLDLLLFVPHMNENRPKGIGRPYVIIRNPDRQAKQPEHRSRRVPDEALPYVAAGIALAGLACLRVEEVARLTKSKVDLDRGLVEISGVIKTKDSARLIPVCPIVVELLRSIIGLPPREKWEGDKDALFPWSHSHYSKMVGRAMEVWNPILAWQPMYLRKCLPQFAQFRQIHSPIWERYMGHAMQGVTPRHYQRIIGRVSIGEEKEKAEDMELFRRTIIDPLQEGIREALAELRKQGRDTDFFDQLCLLDVHPKKKNARATDKESG